MTFPLLGTTPPTQLPVRSRAVVLLDLKICVWAFEAWGRTKINPKSKNLKTVQFNCRKLEQGNSLIKY
jgi:hypothetical protein